MDGNTAMKMINGTAARRSSAQRSARWTNRWLSRRRHPSHHYRLLPVERPPGVDSAIARDRDTVPGLVTISPRNRHAVVHVMSAPRT
jgi:hypothetical protein